MFRALLVLFLLLIAPLAQGNPIDINTASVSELDTLPGIGPSKAQAIVDFRTEHGPFGSVSELDGVPGIGAATLEGLRDQVSVGGTTAQPPAATAGASSPAPAPAPAPAGAAVNINTASASDLQTLPGVGATKAAAIVADRAANGPFSSCGELVRVTGIGPATISGMGDRCVAQ